MSDLAFDEAVRHALDELDAAEDAVAMLEVVVALGRAFVYAQLAVAEAIAAASEDTLGDLVDERVDRALDETLEIACGIEHDPEADTGVIEVAS